MGNAMASAKRNAGPNTSCTATVTTNQMAAACGFVRRNAKGNVSRIDQMRVHPSASQRNSRPSSRNGGIVVMAHSRQISMVAMVSMTSMRCVAKKAFKRSPISSAYRPQTTCTWVCGMIVPPCRCMWVRLKALHRSNAVREYDGTAQ